MTARPLFPRLGALPGGAVLAAAVPFLFLHVQYQPVATAGSISISLSDAAVVVVAAVAAAGGDFGVLRDARGIWISTAALLAYLFAASVYPLAWDDAYAARTHLVSAGKFAEYALLAPAAVLLLRTRRDLLVFLAGVTAWSVVATSLAVAQYAGARILHAWPSGGRQPSLLGIHEFASFSAVTLAAALAVLALGADGERRVRAGAAVALVSGTVGLVLSGAAAGGIGIGLAGVAVAAIGWRRGTLSGGRLAAGAAALVLAAIGLLAVRSGDIGAFARFTGVSHTSGSADSGEVQTYEQRTLMTYLGYRLWLDRPVLGHGWQSVREPAVFEPQLPALRRRFPDQPALAFPSRAHPWGIDNAFVQALAELGAVGTAVFLSFLVVTLAAATAAALAPASGPALLGTLGIAWTLVAVGIWTGQGLVAAAPYDAAAWLGVGLAAAGAAGARRARA